MRSHIWTLISCLSAASMVICGYVFLVMVADPDMPTKVSKWVMLAAFFVNIPVSILAARKADEE